VRFTLVRICAALLLVAPACNNDEPGPGGGSGRIAFATNRYDAQLDIAAINASGSGLVRLTTHLGADAWPTWSPDTTRIAFQSDRIEPPETLAVFQIFVMNADGSGVTQITPDDTLANIMPAWSPLAHRIAFSSQRDGNYEIYVMDPDGQNPLRLTNNAAEDAQAAWSPDGLLIAFVSARDGNSEIYVMDAATGASPTNLTNNGGTDWGPAWSPDGTKIAFCSNREIDFGIWVMDANGSNPVRLTNPSQGVACLPDWSPDGTRLAFEQDGDLWVMRADGTRPVRITGGLGVADGQPRWRPIP
jgi:Tol biopolymer transport system component